jgi:flagella basal body P-ring formation protein FlgA
MYRFVLKILIALSLIGFSSAKTQDIYSTIKEETSKLFLEKLGVSEEELKISFNHISDNLSKYKTNRVEVYSQKSILNPGSQSVWVRFLKGDRIVKKAPVNVNVRIIKDVVVAGKRISRGKGLNFSNLRMESKQLGKDWKQYFFSIKDLIGAESKRLIKKGTALTNRMVRETQLVHSGQKINIQLRSGNLTISTKGIAKQDGATGDEIKLKLNNTGKTIRGIVSSENLVIVTQE